MSVGFGFFLEMTHDEALRFIEKKTSQLTASVHLHLTENINHASCSNICISLHLSEFDKEKLTSAKRVSLMLVVVIVVNERC